MAGKSTLTGWWVARGGQFLSDDWLSLRIESQAILAAPSHPSIRLRMLSPSLAGLSGSSCHAWQDGYAKHWYGFDDGSRSFPGETAPMSAILVYRRSAEASRASARFLPPQKALNRLLSHLFVLDVHSRATWEAVLEGLRQIVNRVPVEEVVVPDGPSGLEAFGEWLGSRRLNG
jgi:hypothetical protein